MGAKLEPELKAVEAGGLDRVTSLLVKGMTCSGCARRVADAVEAVDGVESATVDLEPGSVRVRWRSGTAPDEEAIVQAVRNAGYEPELPSVLKSGLSIEGMTCSGCARKVADSLRSVPGVRTVDVQLDSGRAEVQWQPKVSADEERLLDAVTKAGFKAKLAANLTNPERVTRWSPLAGWQFNVAVGSALTLPLFILEWGLGVGTERWYQWLAFFLVLPVQVLCGARFYRGAWNQLKVGSSNMDTLVVLGSTTAFVYSTWALFAGWHGHLFFMESASIITLVSIGHWVEAKMSVRAARSLRGLMELSPPIARRLDAGGAEVETPVAQLKLGDRIVIKPGDRVPIDCEVVEGASLTDESMLTGESTPVSKAKGSKVFGGTANLHGWLLGRVIATGEATALAQIIAVVQRAQNSRANIQRLGDRVSSVFVPIVILAAIATGLWWGLAPESARAVSAFLEPWLWPAHHPVGRLAEAIYHMAAMLIVACPCAMGLATPVAIMAGTNVAAERGILIRDGVALEKTGGITSVLFDKTGTITQGRIGLAAAEDFLDSAEQAIGFHKIAASLAKPSNHPLSQAVASLSNVTLPVRDWKELRGAGVQGRLALGDAPLAQALFRLGSLSWLGEAGVDVEPGNTFAEEWSRQGATLVGLAADNRLIGLLAFKDSVKEHAREVIETLRRQGKAAYLITGDNPVTASAIASQVGIPETHVFAQIRPEEKAGIVKRLQDEGQHVAFVGDGINDAPALEQADLGIAVARASDVAREAADIILLNSDLRAIPEALALAQATLRTIKQNLFWAFFYNACGIPLAALGFLSPVFSAFAMGASDLIVIGNALRLRRWRSRAG